MQSVRTRAVLGQDICGGASRRPDTLDSDGMLQSWSMARNEPGLGHCQGMRCVVGPAGDAGRPDTLDCGSGGHHHGCGLCHCGRHRRLHLREPHGPHAADQPQPQEDRGGRCRRRPVLHLHSPLSAAPLCLACLPLGQSHYHLHFRMLVSGPPHRGPPHTLTHAFSRAHFSPPSHSLFPSFTLPRIRSSSVTTVNGSAL